MNRSPNFLTHALGLYHDKAIVLSMVKIEGLTFLVSNLESPVLRLESCVLSLVSCVLCLKSQISFLTSTRSLPPILRLLPELVDFLRKVKVAAVFLQFLLEVVQKLHVCRTVGIEGPMGQIPLDSLKLLD